MKIICILHYIEESYYKRENVIPLEYSSIEDLISYIDKRKAEFKSDCEENQRIYENNSKVTSSDRYRALSTSLSIVEKALRIQRNNFSREKRDSEWRRKLLELEAEEKRILEDKFSMTKYLEKPKKVDSSIKVGDKHLMFLSDPDYEQKSLEFFTLEDWFEKNKNK